MKDEKLAFECARLAKFYSGKEICLHKGKEIILFMDYDITAEQIPCTMYENNKQIGV
jgi:hypothetical protein